MGSQWEDYLDEDEACLNCGSVPFHQSKTLGICQECADEFSYQKVPEVSILESSGVR